MHEALEVGVGEFDDFLVGAGVEGDLFARAQAFGDEDFHPVEITEGRHGADLAIRETGFEFIFFDEAHVIAPGDIAEVLEDDFAIGGQDGHGEFAIEFDDDNFGHHATGDMSGGGDFLGGVGLRVADALIFDPLGIEKLFQFLHWHNDPFAGGSIERYAHIARNQVAVVH